MPCKQISASSIRLLRLSYTASSATKAAEIVYVQFCLDLFSTDSNLGSVPRWAALDARIKVQGKTEARGQ